MEPKKYYRQDVEKGMSMLWYEDNGILRYRMVETPGKTDKWYRIQNHWTNKMIHCPEV